MQVTPELYQDMQKQAVPRSNSKVNVLMAFLTGGVICTIGQILFFASAPSYLIPAFPLYLSYREHAGRSRCAHKKE